MRRAPLQFAAWLAAGTACFAQLTVDPYVPVDTLVRKHFAGGCAAISHVTYRGFSHAIGYFDGRNSNIGIDEGVLLTSGAVEVAPGPNRYPDATVVDLQYGDPDLDKLVRWPTWDACVLEFDFVSFKDTVSFEYVFASEEYLEYVGSEYNDVFAFFVSGPGIAGRTNIALLPGSLLPVSVNTVNPYLNGQYYVDNAGGATVEYDGFTTVLAAKLPVIPCETYHMKLAIADVSDMLLDSGVFLKAGSFNPGAHVTVKGERDALENGCYAGLFAFTRSDPIDEPLVVHFTIGGSATDGVDYEHLPDSVVIPAGERTVRVPVYGKRDSVPDANEFATISLTNTCSCAVERDSIRIVDVAPLELSVSPDTALCAGDTVAIAALARGGSGRFVYRWNDSLSTDPAIAVSPSATTRYLVVVTDTVYLCTAVDSVLVTVHPLPAALAGSDAVVCAGDGARLGDSTAAPEPGVAYRWSPDTGLDDPSSPHPFARPDATTTYVLTATSPFGCIAHDTARVAVQRMLLDAGPDRFLCSGAATTIGGRATGSDPPYRYSWLPRTGLDDPDSAVTVARPGATTTYILSAVSARGCVADDTVRVTVSGLSVRATGDTAVCLGDSVRIGGQATNGIGTIVYAWTPVAGVGTPDAPVTAVRPSATTRYVLTVTDGFGCVARDTVLVTVHPAPAVAARALGPTTFCAGQRVELETVGAFRSYRWSNGATTPRIAVAASGSYSCDVVDSNGCSASSAPIEVRVKPVPRPILSGPTSVCIGSDALYAVTGAAGGVATWSNDAGAPVVRVTDDSVLVHWGGAGTVALVVAVDLDGCMAHDTLAVRVAPSLEPRVDPSAAELCAGDSVAVSAETGYPRYLWSTGDTARTIVVRASGTFSVRVWDALGCTGVSDTARVTVHPAPSVGIAGGTGFCEGDSTVLTAEPPAASYRWSTGDTTASIVVRTSGVFTVRVADVHGCTAVSDTHAVVVHPGPAKPAIAAAGDSLVSTPAFAYRWYRDGAPLPGATDRAIVPTDTGVYVVVVSTAFGCEAVSDPVRIAPHVTGVATVRFPVIDALPGQRLRIPLILESGDRLDEVGARAFDATARFDRTAVLPDPPFGPGTIDAGERVVSISGARNDTSNVLAFLPVTVGLGDADSVPLRVASFAFTGAPVSVTRVDGLLRIGICREGGDRLVSTTGRIELAPSRPDPFNASTVVEYETVENGPTTLAVLDALGRCVATLASGVRPPGRYTVVLDAGDLPSGTYFLVLLTPTQTRSRAIRLLK